MKDINNFTEVKVCITYVTSSRRKHVMDVVMTTSKQQPLFLGPEGGRCTQV